MKLHIYWDFTDYGAPPGTEKRVEKALGEPHIAAYSNVGILAGDLNAIVEAGNAWAGLNRVLMASLYEAWDRLDVFENKEDIVAALNEMMKANGVSGRCVITHEDAEGSTFVHSERIH